MDVMARRLSRRTALTIATAGVGGILLPTGAAAWLRNSQHTHPAAHAAAAHASEPVAEALAELATPSAIEATLAATTTAVDVDGRTLPFSYDGTFPGPVLRIREGDHVRLNFVNRLDAITNLHLHGLHISPTVDDPTRRHRTIHVDKPAQER